MWNVLIFRIFSWVIGEIRLADTYVWGLVYRRNLSLASHIERVDASPIACMYKDQVSLTVP